jgi:hypothetical protein
MGAEEVTRRKEDGRVGRGHACVNFSMDFSVCRVYACGPYQRINIKNKAQI